MVIRNASEVEKAPKEKVYVVMMPKNFNRTLEWSHNDNSDSVVELGPKLFWEKSFNPRE